MIEVLETITNIIVAVEVAAALVLTVLNVREMRFLDKRVKPLLQEGEDLPLFDALSFRARYITFVAVWLIALTAIGAVIGPISAYFPPIRAINAGLLLGLLAGPRIVGQALRQRAREASR